MKLIVMACAGASSCVAFAASPVVSDVVLSQRQGSAEVVVDYALSGASGVVVVDFLTNGVSIGARNFSNVAGDVNRVVQPGEHHKITWKSSRTWPNHVIGSGGFTAVVTAHSLQQPPEYMVVNLETGERSYYACIDALPGGVRGPDDDYAHDPYRTTRILMKKVQAQNVSWFFGSPGTESGRDGNRETYARVKLSADYYMGVYEVTRRQYELFAKATPSTSPTYADSDVRPVETVTMSNIRGSGDWPTSRSVSESSALGALSALAGGIAFDLPSEAQWEYACRAGTTSAYHWGTNDESPLGDYAWYAKNWTNEDNIAILHPVGLKRPNRWGFYDMYGNAAEWVLMYFTTIGSGTYAIDRTVEHLDPAFGSRDETIAAYGKVQYVLRGESSSRSNGMRTAVRGNGAAEGKNIGFRIVCPAVAK